MAPEDIDAAAQDSFEREFIDGKPSFDMDDSNAEINISSDMNIKIKKVVNVRKDLPKTLSWMSGR